MPPTNLPPADAALLRLAHALLDTGYRFTTGTPATHARVNARPGNEAARTVADVFGWSRPFAPALLPTPMLDLLRQAGALDQVGDLLRSRVRLSTLHGMAFLHSAYPTQAADSVFFGPDTYRFADAIAAATPATPVHRAADIGCGAGPGGLLVARARPAAEVLLLDINPAALRLAAVNVRLNATPNALPLHSDVLSAAPGPFDLLVANPPYMADPAARAYRDGGGPLGAALSLRILDESLPRLAPGGTLLLYTGAAVVNGHDPFRAAAAGRLDGSNHQWSYRELDPDVFGEELDEPAYRTADRIAAVLLTVTRAASTG